jgi:hypothetical protein
MSFSSLAAVPFTVSLCRRPAKKPTAVPAVKLEQVSDVELQSPGPLRRPVSRHSKGKAPARYLESPVDISSEESGLDQFPVVPKVKGHQSPEVPVTPKAKSPEVPFTPKAARHLSPEVPFTPKAKVRPSGSVTKASASGIQRYLCSFCQSSFWLIILVSVCRTPQDNGAAAKDAKAEGDLSSPSKQIGGDADARLT